MVSRLFCAKNLQQVTTSPFNEIFEIQLVLNSRVLPKSEVVSYRYLANEVDFGK